MSAHVHSISSVINICMYMYTYAGCLQMNTKAFFDSFVGKANYYGTHVMQNKHCRKT